MTRKQLDNIDHRDASLDAPLFVDGADTRLGMLVRDAEGQEDEMARVEREQIVREKLSAIEPALRPRERYVLHHRLLSDEPERLVDVGRRFGVSRERVRQIELRVKQQLQRALAELAPESKAA
jgi:RNA polymerase sigma-32 factor